MSKVQVHAVSAVHTLDKNGFIPLYYQIQRALMEKIHSGELSEGDLLASEEELAPGRGRILHKGLSKVAVSRDEAGDIHRLAAACTHAGCTVSWNSFEQCWDCPCNGSQFAPDGEALNAPAVETLAAG